jgi:3-oxoacyl-[acyl-carrier protein] reductase
MKRCALITGASRGIGKAIAETISKDSGLHIIINYASNDTAAKETLQTIESNGGTGELLKFQVQNKEEVDQAIEQWYDKNPDSIIDTLINNAGITDDGLMVFMEENSWDSVVDISLKGFYNVTHAVLPKLVRNRKGRIVNVVSVSGLKGNAGQANYSAAKGGVIAATKALAQEIAKRKITVNAVAPGFINSDMTKDFDEGELKKYIPANRFGEAQEVADLVSFLCSEKAGYITGEVININGGLYS